MCERGHEKVFYVQITEWSSSNYIMLIGGHSGAQVADVADIINPTRDCQSSTIATFPCLSPCNEAEWQPQGGWVDGVLIICTSKNTNKCYALSQDGKFHMILQSVAD